MKKESRIQLDFLDLLLEIVDLLEKTGNSVERQTSLYYLRRLGSINISTGRSEDGATSFEINSKRYELIQKLSVLGTESLVISTKED